MQTDMSSRARAGVDERPVGALAAQANSVLMSRVAREIVRHGVTGGKLLEMGSQTVRTVVALARDDAFARFAFVSVHPCAETERVAQRIVLEEGLEARIHVVLGAPGRLDLAAGTVGCIAARSVIDRSVDAPHAYRELFDLLEPGGFALIHDLRGDAPAAALAPIDAMREAAGLAPIDLSARYSADEVLAHLAQAGLADTASVSSGDGGMSIGLEVLISKPLFQ